MGKINKIGIIGAGNMGAGIAQKMAQEGLNVTLVDIKEEFVKRGLSIIENTLKEGLERKIFTQAQIDATLSRLTGTVDRSELADADLIIEAVFEDKKVKGDLFEELDGICEPKTIFATNTSSFYVKEIAERTKRQDRVVGMHYFYHPAKNRLLEVIPHEGSSQETIDTAMFVGKLHAKTCILVKDAPGFAVNRFFVPFLTESVKVLQEGIANIPTIEHAAIEAFKIGMGPFELMNVTGIPIAVHASTTLGAEISPFYDTPEMLKAQMEKGTNWDLSGDVEASKVNDIVERLQGACLGVAAALVDEGVATIEDTDRGAKIGLRWALGPFELMNEIGIEKTYQVVKKITEIYPDFKMPQILANQAAKKAPFEFNFVDLEIKNNVATITINRPEAMNALNSVVVEQLEKQFKKAEDNPKVTAIVFQGAGKAFVAGADIKFFVDNIKNNTINKTVSFTKQGHDLLLRVENSPKLTITQLDGLSLGGGSELALACQAIVATEGGSLGFPETGIGIYPGLGGMLRLAKQIGPELTKYYVLTGRFISASDANALGIITKLVQTDQLEEAIQEIVKAGAPDKYRSRSIPAKFDEFHKTFSSENVSLMLSGGSPQGVDAGVAEKILKTLKRKAPLALKMANELIDQQVKASIPEGIKLELARLVEVFSTEDALVGLQSRPGDRVEFKGK